MNETTGKSPEPATKPDDGREITEGRATAERHEEWLLDESLRETFPASDPISPARSSKSGTS